MKKLNIVVIVLFIVVIVGSVFCVNFVEVCFLKKIYGLILEKFLILLNFWLSKKFFNRFDFVIVGIVVVFLGLIGLGVFFIICYIICKVEVNIDVSDELKEVLVE